MRTALALVTVATLGSIAATACTPDEVTLWASWANDHPTGCHEAVDRLWPASSRGWAHRIVERESRGNPGAQNRRSSAAGCFQMLRMHAGRFTAVGGSWADRYVAWCNTKAALNLYESSGRAPWGG